MDIIGFEFESEVKQLCGRNARLTYKAQLPKIAILCDIQ